MAEIGNAAGRGKRELEATRLQAAAGQITIDSFAPSNPIPRTRPRLTAFLKRVNKRRTNQIKSSSTVGDNSSINDPRPPEQSHNKSRKKRRLFIVYLREINAIDPV